MHFPFYIAKRYLVSKKSSNVVNIITKVAIAGVAVGSMALIIVLSAFNGIENVVISLFNSFDPQLKIEVAEGKTFDVGSAQWQQVKKLPEVAHFTEIIEENALLKYKDKQYIATIKGVSEEYRPMSRLDTMLIDGSFTLSEGEVPYTVIGQGVAVSLGINLAGAFSPVYVYVPRRTKNVTLSPEQAFTSMPIYASGVFSIQHDFDSKYIITPISFARELLDYPTQVTSVEIGLKQAADVQAAREQIQNILGTSFKVKDRYQQNDALYRIMRSEKLATFLILTFILIIATFNVIGSVTMLIIDKKQDILILNNLGANPAQIKQVFFIEGLLISVTGTMFGLLFGLMLCLLQQHLGLVKIPGSFVMESYPIGLETGDFIRVFLTVLLIGTIAAWVPARIVATRYMSLVKAPVG